MPNKSANVGPGGKNQLQQNSCAPGSGRIADRGRMIILVGRPTRNLERTLVDTRSGFGFSTSARRSQRRRLPRVGRLIELWNRPSWSVV